MAFKNTLKERIYYWKQSRKYGSTDVNRVRSLIASLRPVTSSFPLIRWGDVGDGGYLIPDCIDGLSTVFSLGVADSVSFERDCVKRGMRAIMADASVAAPEITSESEQYTFFPNFIGAYRADEYITFADLHAKSGISPEEEFIIQMDIEGSEYQVLLQMPEELLQKARVIVVEFHELTGMFSPLPFNIIHACFQRLLSTHEVVHIHPNNYGKVAVKKDVVIPSLMEFTFLRKDVGTFSQVAQSYPHPLDADCTPLRPLVLPENWHY